MIDKLKQNGVKIAFFLAVGFLIFRLFIADDKNPSVFNSPYANEIAAAFVGTLLTVIVTALLLEKTSESQAELLNRQLLQEENKERNVEYYKAKLEAYQALMETIEKIILEVTPKDSRQEETDSIQIDKAKIRLDLQCQKTFFIATGNVPDRLQRFVDKFLEVTDDGLAFTYQDD